MELVLSDFIGHGIIFGLCSFICVYALMSKKDNPEITKGLPFFFIIIFIVLLDAFKGGELFGGIAQNWMEAFG